MARKPVKACFHAGGRETSLDFRRRRPKLRRSMASLAQLLAHHGSILLLDASSSRVQAGLLRRGAPAIWHKATGDAGQALFPLVEACLREGELTLRDVGAQVFCAGPGSMLGVRIVAMVLRTWQALTPRPAYQFLSLTLLAHELARTNATRPGAVIADARRDTWHTVAVGADGSVGPLQRLAAAELTALPHALYQPAAFRAWSNAPRTTLDLPYDLAALFAHHGDTDLFSPAPAPDAFQHEAPEYKKWSAQVHSAVTAPPR